MKKHLIPVASLALPLAFLASCGSSVPQDDSSLPPADDSSSSFDASSSTANGGSGGSTGSQEPAGDGLTQQAARAKNLREQKTELLVAERMDSARAAYADGRFQSALNDVRLALDLDPTNREVRTMLSDIQVAMGTAITSDDGSDPALRLRVKLDMIKAETEAHAEQGARLLADGDYSGAVNALTLARANVDAVPFNIEWGDLPAQIQADLDKALADRELAEILTRDNARSDAFAAMQREADEKRAAKEQRIDRMLEDAIMAYADEDFDRAITLSESILRKNPLDTRAAEIRDASVRTRHELVAEEFVIDREERFRLWLEELAEAKIPQTDLFRGPDADHWERITAMRASYASFSTGAELDPLNRELSRKIASSDIPGLRLDGVTDLNEVINQLKLYTDVPFVVHQAAVEAVDSEGIEFKFDLVGRMSVLNALETITLAAGEEVVYTINNGVVHITTKENAFGQLITKPHDIQDLTIQYTDYSGPRIDKIWLPDDEANEEEDGSLYGGPFGEPRTLVNPDEIADLVIGAVEPSTWDEATAEYANGFLIVTHTPAMQAKVDEFLQSLRRYNSSMVSIEARFLTIQKDFMKEIGVDFRGLGGFPDVNDLIDLDDITSGLEDNASAGLDNNGSGLPLDADTNPSGGLFFDEAGRWETRARTENILGDYGTERMSALGGLTMQFAFLDDAQSSLILRAVEKSNRAQELNSSSVTALNTQRAFMTVLNQVTYIQDMDVEVAQAASAADPVIGVVSDGIVIDVRPIISHDRKYITLELQPTVATLLRPIPEFTSSLSGLTTPVTLQLPELFIASAKTNAIVPDGGTVVIAGLRKLLDIEQRAEIPFLAKIPILSVLFKSEGEAYENEDIIVLIRAEILDVAAVKDELDSRLAEGR